jgi:hypothetical protein
MNALSHEFDLVHATMLPPTGAPGPRGTDLELRWDALHEAADAVALLAQLGPESPASSPTSAIASLPARASRAGGWRCEAIANGIDDLALVMQTGLRALISAADQGRDTTAAALTLWREFHVARLAICAFVEPEPGAV